MKKLDFTAPFCGFMILEFINCFSAVYAHLESIQENQEQFFFLFDTMCGRSAVRYRFDGEPTGPAKRIGVTDEDNRGTNDTMDFLFGFAGYAYRKITDAAAFKDEIITAIDAGKPVIAKVKAGKGRFRVITGYDGKKLIEPSYNESLRWHKEPKKATKHGDIEALIIVGDKIQPRYTLIDGLRRIVEVMEYNSREKPWESWIEQFTYFPPTHIKNFYEVDNKEKQARMKKLGDIMWTMDGYSFQNAFNNHNLYEELQNPALTALKIGDPYGQNFDLYYSLIGLAECADWKKHSFSGGFVGEIAVLALRKIQENEEAVLETVKQAIAILEQGGHP